MRNHTPKPPEKKSNFTFKISIIALSIIGVYCGVIYIKGRIENYIYSFFPDVNYYMNGAFSEFNKFFYENRTDIQQSNFNQHDNVNLNNLDIQKMQNTFESFFKIFKNQNLENIQAGAILNEGNIHVLSGILNESTLLFFNALSNLEHGKKIVKKGLYKVSYYVFEHIGIEKPEWFLNPAAKVTSIALTVMGAYKIINAIFLRNEKKETKRSLNAIASPFE